MAYAYHSLVPLLGIAVAGLTLVGAIAVGPYGRRGVRLLLATVSFAAVLGVAFWFLSYVDLVEQRRSIETRLFELRGQALSAGSPLACLERTGDAVEAGCAHTLFAAPETLAAAKLYTAARLDLLVAATRYPGPRTPQFDEAVATMKRALQDDPFGLTAHSLTLRESCTVERCDVIASLPDPARVLENIHRKTFDANVASYGGAWRTQARSAAPRVPASPVTPAASVAAPVALLGPADAEGSRTPIPDKYTLPSAASIPPVSIMNDEPPERPNAAPVKDRAANPPPRPVAAAPVTEQTLAPQPATVPTEPAAPDKPAPARRDKGRTAAPLSIVPTR